MAQQLTFRIPLSLALFSAGGLMLEITLTRLLSTLYFPPLIFAVLSVAILGIGIGAALVAWLPVLRQAERLIPYWMLLAGVTGLVLGPASVVLATIDALPLLMILMLLPYLFIGVALSTLFASRSSESPLLYAYDLVGAGIGAVLVIPLLNLFGALDGVLLAGGCLMLAGIVYQRNRLTTLALIVAVGVFGSNVLLGWLTVDLSNLSAEKPIQEALGREGQILATRWDAFARTDLVDPPDNQPYRVYVDGAAASVMPPATDSDFLISDIGLFAFVTAQPEKIFAIGSGAGLDVWFGLQVGAENITAVEVNPGSVALTREYADYNGDIYDQPNVRVLVDEGRSVLRREDVDYDLISIAQVVTLTAERSGYALTENAVFTVEAFQDYWAHLTEGGYLSLKLYDEQTLSRALSLVIAILNQLGMNDQEALQHTIVLLSPATSPPTPLLMLRKTAFTQEEAIAIGRAAQRVGFATLYVPFVQADPPLDAVESGVNTFQEVIDISPLDLSAPTDDRPFFYQFERGIPQNLQPLLLGLAVVVIAGVMILLFVRWRVHPPSLGAVVVYFAALGFGFIAVEIALIQYTRLFIGHPTTAITVVLAMLLVSGGIGSAVYHWRGSQRVGWRIFILIAVVLGIWVALWTSLSPQWLGGTVLERVLVAGVGIAPVGFLMGIPFAAGLRVVGALHPGYVPLAWSVNGVLTVVGSVVAVTLALVVGYSMVMAVGILAYLLGAIATVGFAK